MGSRSGSVWAVLGVGLVGAGLVQLGLWGLDRPADMRDLAICTETHCSSTFAVYGTVLLLGVSLILLAVGSQLGGFWKVACRWLARHRLPRHPFGKFPA